MVDLPPRGPAACYGKTATVQHAGFLIFPLVRTLEEQPTRSDTSSALP